MNPATSLCSIMSTGYSVFAVVSDTIDGGLPDSEADRYFRKNSHLAYASHGTSSNGNAVAGSSRRRPSDFDDEMEIEGRAAQRRRTSDDEADDVREATNGMAETGLYDEEEMMKRAMEESLREMVRQPERPRPTKWRPKEDAPKPNGVAPKASTSAKPVVATEADEDDSPTVEECAQPPYLPLMVTRSRTHRLRRRRLARFGG